MIYAITNKNPETVFRFETWDALHASTFSPYGNTTVFSIPCFIPGRNYRERKHAAENALHRAAEIMSAPGLSWGELAEIGAECERIARRYGQLREARENALC